jgi:predicted helicase
VETLRHIHSTLVEKGADALTAQQVKKAAMERVFGFEILPAPFVVSHLQLGLLLQNLGAPFSDDNHERAAVYLTNALTGWEPPKDPKQHLVFPELEQERDAAAKVKQSTPILVILGNPPYNGYAGVSIGEERDLTLAYRTTKKAPPPQGQGLNDLYVRFFRMAERRIVDMTGKGVVCFISNYSWLDGLSFTGMRERYLEAFDEIWIDCLNGDKYKTGKLTPDGKPDPSVFSTEFNREGIQVGTAIGLLCRLDSDKQPVEVRFQNLWGKDKRSRLLANLGKVSSDLYIDIAPALALGLPFKEAETATGYDRWPILTVLFAASHPGIQPCRDELVVDIDRDRLVNRMEKYFSPAISHDQMRQISASALEDTAGFDAVAAREKLRKRGFLKHNVVPYTYRPFDLRWLYWEPETKLLDRNRPDYVPHIHPENVWIAAVQQNRKEFDPPLITRLHASRHIVERGANLFPLSLKPVQQTLDMSASDEPQAASKPNLSLEALHSLASCRRTASFQRIRN